MKSRASQTPTKVEKYSKTLHTSTIVSTCSTLGVAPVPPSLSFGVLSTICVLLAWDVMYNPIQKKDVFVRNFKKLSRALIFSSYSVQFRIYKHSSYPLYPLVLMYSCTKPTAIHSSRLDVKLVSTVYLLSPTRDRFRVSHDTARHPTMQRPNASTSIINLKYFNVPKV